MKKGTGGSGRKIEERNVDEKERKKERRETEKKEGSEMDEEKERKKGRKRRRKRERGNLALSRRLLSVWPALPALRAPDGTLLKFIDNHKFRK